MGPRQVRPLRERAIQLADTKLRVDSEELGVGTEIDAEDLLGLESSDTNWDIQGEVRLGDKHQLFGAYTDFVRENSRRIEREITNRYEGRTAKQGDW